MITLQLLQWLSLNHSKTFSILQNAINDTDMEDVKEKNAIQMEHKNINTLFASWQKNTLSNALKAWENIAGTARAIKGTIDPDLPDIDKDRILSKMQDCLERKGGEVSSRRNAVELGQIYLSLTPMGKKRFLELISNEFDTNHQAVDEAMNALQTNTDPNARIKLEKQLRDSLIPPRVSILQQFSTLPQGIKFLVDMRGDTLVHGKNTPEIKALSYDLQNILSSLFDIGLLDIHQIGWNAPAELLEKLIAYEAVHEIKSWSDLKNRLDSDRRCFAFFHPKMPKEPLIFVEIALVNGIADSIHELLDETKPTINPYEADTAIFYSISNTQKGLGGISLGNFLIKRVVDKLLVEFPKLKYFATLSPIPGFSKWLQKELEDGNESILTKAEKEVILKIENNTNTANGLQDILSKKWYDDITISESLKPILLRLCSYYLLIQKRKKKALDPVANFHLTNGARMERLNWMANMSPRGIKESFGIMVNYKYILSQIENNHETYSRGKTIPASKQVKL